MLDGALAVLVVVVFAGSVGGACYLIFRAWSERLFAPDEPMCPRCQQELSRDRPTPPARPPPPPAGPPDLG